MMTLLAPLAIWLAKILIIHFLQTSFQLKRELEEAVARDTAFKADLAELERTEIRFVEDLKRKQEYIIGLRQQILDKNTEIDKLNEEYNANKKKINDTIDSMSDDDVLRSAI